MKHDFQPTLILLALFFVSQLVGLGTINAHIQPQTNELTGEIDIIYPATAIGESPKIENKSTSFIYILIGVLVGTALLLLFAKFKFNNAWRYWFLLSVVLTLAVAWGVFLPHLIALPLALVFGLWKVFRPNIFVHNITEMFIYTGIAIIFLPILNLVSATFLLLLISVYDAYAVWKSKHMITLAKFQQKSKLFAGLVIPYAKDGMKSAMKAVKPSKPEKTTMAKATASKKAAKIAEQKGGKTAILGGGDIAFPLLFTSTVMDHMLRGGLSKATSLGLSAIITVTTTIALCGLLMFAKKDRFYPAMPFISVGCFAGLGIIWLLGFL